MILNLTQFGDSSSGIGALGLDGKALVIQVITFLLAIWILQRFAVKPIVKMMERRRETIEKGVELGQQMQKEKQELEAKVAEALHKARTDADKIVSDAQATAKAAIRQAEDEAREKADRLVAQADARIKQDAARARQQLEKEIVGLVSDATEVIIGEKVDTKKDAALIEKALKEADGMSTSRTQLAQVVADKSLKKDAGKKLAGEVAAYLLGAGRVADLDPLMRDVWADLADQGYVEAVAISAHQLDDNVLADIKSKVRKIYPAGKQIVVSSQYDPEVIGGIRLELPHQQLDLTVEAKLSEFKQLTTARKGKV